MNYFERVGKGSNNLGKQLAVVGPAYENIRDPFRVDYFLTGPLCLSLFLSVYRSRAVYRVLWHGLAGRV